MNFITIIPIEAPEPDKSLLIAARDGHAAAARDALALGANPNARDQHWDRSALAWACHAGSLEVLGLLIDAKADLLHRDRHGSAPIDVAIHRGSIPCSFALIDALPNPPSLEQLAQWTQLAHEHRQFDLSQAIHARLEQIALHGEPNPADSMIPNPSQRI